jgi:hypothetical protein
VTPRKGTTFHGRICAKHPNGAGLRYAKRHACWFCSREWAQKWVSKDPAFARAVFQASAQRFRDNHVEQERARSRKRHHADPAKAARKMAHWRENNRDKARAADRNWRVANPDRVREIKNGRRKECQSPNLGAENRARIKAIYAAADRLGLEVDHVVPMQHKLVCGLHVWHNLQLLDLQHNRAKGNRHWPDMP